MDQLDEYWILFRYVSICFKDPCDFGEATQQTLRRLRSSSKKRQSGRHASGDCRQEVMRDGTLLAWGVMLWDAIFASFFHHFSDWLFGVC